MNHLSEKPQLMSLMERCYASLSEMDRGSGDEDGPRIIPVFLLAGENQLICDMLMDIDRQVKISIELRELVANEYITVGARNMPICSLEEAEEYGYVRADKLIKLMIEEQMQ